MDTGYRAPPAQHQLGAGPCEGMGWMPCPSSSSLTFTRGHARETEAQHRAMQVQPRQSVGLCPGSRGRARGWVLLTEARRVLAVPQRVTGLRWAWHWHCPRANIYPGWRAWLPRWEMPRLGQGPRTRHLQGAARATPPLARCHHTLGVATSTHKTSGAPRGLREKGDR